MSVQGERARGGRASYGDDGLLCGSHWLLPCTNPRGNGGWGWGGWGCECARRVCKVSVQSGNRSLWGWGAVIQLPLVAAFFPMDGGTNPIGKSGVGVCKCAR